MKFTDTDLSETYDKATEHTKDVIFAVETAKLVDAVTDQHGIPKEKKSVVAEELLYVLLGLTTKEDMVLRLNTTLSLPEGVSMELVTSLTEQLFGSGVNVPVAQTPATSIGDTVPKANRDIREKLELHPDGIAKPQLGEERLEKDPAKPLTREDVLNALESRRTMGSDIESVKKDQETHTE